MYCNATTVVKIDLNTNEIKIIDSEYKRNKNYYLEVYVLKCKYTDAESQPCSMLSDGNGYFEASNEIWAGFFNLDEGYKK